MDKYDNLILEIIHEHKFENPGSKIGLSKLERTFWKRVETDESLNLGHGRIGERITKLYLGGLIENKSGYLLTRKGKSHLNITENIHN